MVTFGWIASAFHASQKRPKIIAIHNFNHRLGDAHRAAAIQILFGNAIATIAKTTNKLTWN